MGTKKFIGGSADGPVGANHTTSDVTPYSIVIRDKNDNPTTHVEYFKFRQEQLGKAVTDEEADFFYDHTRGEKVHSAEIDNMASAIHNTQHAVHRIAKAIGANSDNESGRIDESVNFYSHFYPHFPGAADPNDDYYNQQQIDDKLIDLLGDVQALIDAIPSTVGVEDIMRRPETGTGSVNNFTISGWPNRYQNFGNVNNIVDNDQFSSFWRVYNPYNNTPTSQRGSWEEGPGGKYASGFSPVDRTWITWDLGEVFSASDLWKVEIGTFNPYYSTGGWCDWLLDIQVNDGGAVWNSLGFYNTSKYYTGGTLTIDPSPSGVGRMDETGGWEEHCGSFICNHDVQRIRIRVARAKYVWSGAAADWWIMKSSGCGIRYLRLLTRG